MGGVAGAELGDQRSTVLGDVGAGGGKAVCGDAAAVDLARGDDVENVDFAIFSVDVRRQVLAALDDDANSSRKTSNEGHLSIIARGKYSSNTIMAQIDARGDAQAP